MRTYFFILFASFLLIVFSSCSDAMNKTYSSQSYVNDIEAIKQSNKTSFEDIEILTKYIALSKIAGNDLQGKTYEEILDKIKTIRKNNSDQSTQLEMEKEAARQRMSSYLTVSISDKIFSNINNKDCFTYNVIFRNTSSKNIKMVVGSISLNDLLDREIKNIPIVLDEPLRGNLILNKKYIESYDQNNENDKRIRSKNLVDLRVIWNPVKIIFTDGTKAE